jgi:hypothetical protein
MLPHQIHWLDNLLLDFFYLGLHTTPIMKIKLQEALDLIQAADVVRVTDMDGFIDPRISFSDIEGKPDNEFMYMSWDDEHDEFGARFLEDGNDEVEREGNRIVIVDSEGSEFEFNLFRLVPVLP